jgi:hypothetical protein
MKTTTTKKMNLFGKHSGYYTCTLDSTGWQADGKTKQEAEANLYAMLVIDWASRYTVRYIRCEGATFCLRHEPGGWVYDIVRDASPDNSGSCQMGDIGLDKAMAAMVAHAKDFTL